MVDLRISELTDASALDGTEEVPLIQGGPLQSRRATVREIGFAGAYALRARASQNAGQALPVGVPTLLQFQSEDYDTGGFFDVGQNTRMTVPAGVSVVELGSYIQFTGVSETLATVTGSFAQIRHRNAANALISDFRVIGITTLIGSYLTEPIPVNLGDYFEIAVTTAGTGPYTTVADGRVFISMSALG